MKLKLVIVSTPKSGNTWLRLLLHEVWGLPMPEIPFEFSEEALSKLPESWVAQQHYFPSQRLLAWAEREKAVFLTTIRHPGDVLVSLWHYVHAYANDPRWEGDPVGVMRGDRDRPGGQTAAYVREGFPHYLDLSLAWIANGRSIIVKYEDLCRDPDAELARVVRAIHRRRPDAGLPLDRTAGAVAACEIGMLRKGLGLDPLFFRKGGSGGWADELPPEVLSMFRSLPPYPDLFAALGYSPDPRSAERSAPRGGTVADPFGSAERFADGTRITPFLVRLYLTLDDAARARLHPLAGMSDPASYQAWLCAPAAGDARAAEGPLLTNLAAALHAVRPDLQRVFPDPFGRDREKLAEWFVHNAERDHGIDPALVSAAHESWSACTRGRATGTAAEPGPAEGAV